MATQILLALAAATGFATAQVTAKRGVQGASVVTGLYISILAGWLVSLAAVAIRPPTGWNLLGIGIFVAAGAVTAGLGRMFSITGIDRLGASVHSPIQNSVSPTVAVIAGTVLFSETLGSLKVAGTAAIIVGVWSVSRSRNRSAALSSTTATLSNMMLPVLAGLSIAAGDVLRKHGLLLLASPELALLAGMSAALVIWATIRVFVRTSQQETMHARAWFFTSGVAAAGAQLALLHALNVGDLSVVSPIANIQPLIVLALSAALLREVERLNVMVVIGGICTVLGVIAISVGS